MRTEKRYTGYWYLQNDSMSMAGNLIVGKGITLTLVDHSKKQYSNPAIEIIKGIAQDEKRETFHFILYKLELLNSWESSQNLQTYEFSASYLILSTQSQLLTIAQTDLETEDICINSNYLNSWCRWPNKEHNYRINENKVDYYYFHPSPTLLSEMDNCNIYASVSGSIHLDQHRGFFNKLESHIDIKFFETIKLCDSFYTISKIEYLLSLFMDIPVVNDSLSFKSKDINCICIQNIQQKHYNFRQLTDSEASFTSTSLDIMKNGLLNHWFEFYDLESDALNLFFNTIYNKELTDEIRIICFSAVLEDLSKRYFVSGQFKQETKRTRMLQTIINILKKDSHPQEANYLKTTYLDRDESFKNRLLSLLNRYQDVWEPLEIEPFANKVVNTRNFLVHRQCADNQKQKICPIEDYKKLADTLRYIISGILLKELGISSEDIIRILVFIQVWTTDDFIRIHPEYKEVAKFAEDSL